MRHAAEMGRSAAWPDGYRWNAVWWRLHARDSRNGAEALLYARNQAALCRDALARPGHYRRKPADLTDWQWSGLAARPPRS